MPTFDVHFTQPASAAVRAVEAEDPDEAIDLAYDQLPGSLCHHCAREVEMGGTWEPDVVIDESGDVVWEERL